jgi:hypothetical protein
MTYRPTYDRLIKQHEPQLIEDEWLQDHVEPKRFLVLYNVVHDPNNPGTDFEEDPMHTQDVSTPAEFWEIVRTGEHMVPAEDRGWTRVHFAYDLATGTLVTPVFSG